MDFTALIEAFLRRVEERGLARLEAELRQLANALDAWLHDLLAHPRPDWREHWDAFLAWQEAEGRIPTPQSKQSVVAFLESWAATIDWPRAKEQLSGQSSLAVLEPWAELQLDGTRVRPSNRFGAQEPPGPPELPEEEGPGILDELLDPQLEALVRSAEEYRQSQIEAHGDSYWGMFFRTLNQAIHRYGFGIEARHESLESPSERTAGDIADFSKGASDLAFVAAGVGSVKTPARKAARGATQSAQLPKKLRRPKLRKQTKQAIEDAADKTPDGKFIDPNSDEVIEGQFHYGHIEGKEHRRLAAQGEQQGMTQAEFNDWVNSHPEWFEIQDPKSNRSHRFEKPGND